MNAKKKIHKLAFDFESDFKLIGIASHENDYRLSWAINKFLNIDFIKADDLLIHHPKHKIEAHYSMYTYFDEDNFIGYNLISNKSEKGFLLPQMTNIDFILKVSEETNADQLNNLLKSLKKIDIIITAFFIEDLPDKVKNIFIF
jgi:hypothetical protein